MQHNGSHLNVLSRKRVLVLSKHSFSFIKLPHHPLLPRILKKRKIRKLKKEAQSGSMNRQKVICEISLERNTHCFTRWESDQGFLPVSSISKYKHAGDFFLRTEVETKKHV